MESTGTVKNITLESAEGIIETQAKKRIKFWMGQISERYSSYRGLRYVLFGYSRALKGIAHLRRTGEMPYLATMHQLGYATKEHLEIIETTDGIMIAVKTGDGKYQGIDQVPYVQCDECGKYVNSTEAERVVNEDKCFCGPECAESADYLQCDGCGEWIYYTDAFSPDEMEIYCSEQCAEENNWRKCDCCGNWYLRDDLRFVHNDDLVCEDCLTSYYSECVHCGEWYPNEYMSDYDTCDNCYEEYYGNGLIHEYGYNDPIKFFGNEEHGPFLGIELEVDDGDYYPSELAEALTSNCDTKYFWMTEDGSLDDGLEIGSQPMSLDYHVASKFWESVTETCKNYGFVSHDSSNCGLHIHINRAYFGSDTMANVAGYKLTLLVQRFHDELTKFSRRRDTHWCNYFAPGAPDFREIEWMNRPIVEKSAIACQRYGHSVAINMEHKHDFEVRIFRGTLNLETLYASLALVDGLARYVKAHTEISCRSVTWIDLMGWIFSTCHNTHAKICFLRYLTRRELADFAA